ncbi:type II toxin-antitoxin system VapC family toxin [Rhodopseudomonas palustris]|uniref:Ribonuclease VapC n=1 Tax=Rhodopseudomonas palustris (strain BisB18) TaxID=316056 RepID=Q212Q0_RHOPB
MSDFVVDASVAVKWFVNETDSELADDLSSIQHRLFAPKLIVTEVANVLARKAVAGLLPADRAFGFLRSLPNYLNDVIDIDELTEPAFHNAVLLRHPIYDLIYLEAARRLDALLITADRRLVEKLASTEHARYVTLLSDWQSA